MRSIWQIRGIAAVAMLSLAAGSGLALAQAPSTDTGTGTTPSTTAPGGAATAPSEGATTSQGAASGQSTAKLSKSDRRFMRKAAQGGLAEVQLGKLAQEKGGDQAVKDFGQRMVTDHTQANDQLMTLAQNMNVQLPTKMSKKDEKELDKLQGLSGAKFDKAYAKLMRKDHRMDIREFEHEAKHSKDTQLKQFAQTTLPTLKEHLSLAEKLPGSSRTASASRSAPTER